MGGKQGAGRERNIQEESVRTPLFKDRRRYDSDDDESTNFSKVFYLIHLFIFLFFFFFFSFFLFFFFLFFFFSFFLFFFFFFSFFLSLLACSLGEAHVVC